MLTKIAIWAAILSAFSWLMNSTLTHPKLVELAQQFNKWAALFALLSAIALLISEHLKDCKNTRNKKERAKDESFDRILSGNPKTPAEHKALDEITKPLD